MNPNNATTTAKNRTSDVQPTCRPWTEYLAVA
jgi:hypothetical protein